MKSMNRCEPPIEPLPACGCALPFGPWSLDDLFTSMGVPSRFIEKECAMSDAEHSMAGEVVACLAETSESEHAAAEKFGIGVDAVLEAMVNAGYERCPVCDYWLETGEFVDDDNNDFIECRDCAGGRS